MSRDITLNLNGHGTRYVVEDRTLLCDALMAAPGAGVPVGCEHGVCGSCTVLIDGQAARSCLMFAVQADGKAVHTVKGLADPEHEGGLSALQSAFHRHHALQCGFCTAGILMSLTAFLRERPNPTRVELQALLSGHICRCTGYQHIIDAVLSVTRPNAVIASDPA